MGISPKKPRDYKKANEKALSFDGGPRNPSTDSGIGANWSIGGNETGTPDALEPSNESAFGTVSIHDAEKYVKEYTYPDAQGRMLADQVFFQFAGEHAKIADKMKLAEAQRMEERGALIVFGGKEMPCSAQDVDNLDENGDNRRGSDEVDERTAREIKNEKSAVRENYQGTDAWMKAPNGKPTNLTEDQWLAARTKAFKDEYGDWEKAAASLKFESQIPIEVKENLISWHEGESVYQQAEKIFTDNYPDEQKIATPVGIVTVDKKSIHDSLSHRAPQKKLDAVLSIVPGMRNAAYLDTIPDYDNPRVKYHYFAYRINYKKAEHIVFCRAKEGEHKRRLYVYEVTTREEVQKKSDTLGTQHEDVRPSKELRGIALYTSILHKLINNVKDNSVSIAVDGNGEPIFGELPNKPDAGGKPKSGQTTQNTAQAQSRSENQGGFSYGQNPADVVERYTQNGVSYSITSCVYNFFVY